jgi:hypothetical protein
VDAINRCIDVRPAAPKSWPHLASRQQVGQTRYDIHYTARDAVQTVAIDALDPVPEDYTLRVGVRIPPGAHLESVELDGQVVPANRWRRKSGCGPDVDDELWIEAPFAERATARFRTTMS